MPQPDLSLYTPPPKPFNPLETAQGLITLQHGMGENKLQQQAIRGREALGRIVSQNMNPDGTPNPPGILSAAAKDPDASWMVLQLQEEAKNANPLTATMGTNKMGQPISIQKPYYEVAGQNNPNWQVPQLSQDKIDELHAHNQALKNTLAPLIDDPELDHKKVIGAVSDLVANPDAKFSAMDGATALGKIPFGPNGAPPSADELRQGIKPIVDQQIQHEQVLSQHYPSSQQLAARQSASSFAQDEEAPAQPVNLNDGHGNSPIEVEGTGSATGLPAGYTSPQTKSRENFNEVDEAAKNAPNMNAAYSEAINLVNAGAPTGTKLTDWYQWAAKNDPLHIITGQGTTDKASQTQELGKWMAQGLLSNGMPGSDARLQQLQHGNLNETQLAETVKELAPFFKAVAQGAVAKQKYYNRVTNNGSDLSHEPQAAQNWNENYDPRWVEYDSLDKKDRHAFLVKHPDLLDKKDNYAKLQQMGVVK